MAIGLYTHSMTLDPPLVVVDRMESRRILCFVSRCGGDILWRSFGIRKKRPDIMLASIFLGVHRCCRSRIVVPDSSSFPPSSQWCSCIDCLYSPIGIQYRIASRPLLSVYNALHTIRKSLSSLGQDRESLQHRGVSGCYYFKNWGSPRSLLEYFAIMRTFGIDTPFTSCIQRIETGL